MNEMHEKYDYVRLSRAQLLYDQTLTEQNTQIFNDYCKCYLL